MRRIVSILAIVLLVSVTAFATNQYYSDLEGQSPNGRYAAEAKSPLNEKGKKRTPFQKEFTVSFRDRNKNKTLWVWRQGENDASPVELIPTEEGQLIMLDAWNNYHVFDAKGVKAKVFDPLQSLPKEEKEVFTDRSTAGVFWSQYSQQGFLTHQKRAYFYVRLYWGRTFILDITTAKLETNAALVKQVEGHVLKQTRQLIKKFNGEYYSKCTSCDDKHLRSDLTDAVFVIRKHSIPEGQKLLLNVLKKSDDGRNSTLIGYLERVEAEGQEPLFDLMGIKRYDGTQTEENP